MLVVVAWVLLDLLHIPHFFFPLSFPTWPIFMLPSPSVQHTNRSVGERGVGAVSEGRPGGPKQAQGNQEDFVVVEGCSLEELPIGYLECICKWALAL